ncbi:hypothetical protein C7M61_002786 [Candidozyma pseudohaemuli]|uniref:Large ribosomal subunit protein mL38 n=1 Tax=Candidozyma pseudohaemuli TaxID=418784 RepID=A0A2P7YQL0_9ASCO|nr:hypothetical protein C7M61_002786 [[Candida] pseudohaemulonii]PSK38229.1 hypothetical protein C7M61_002786 [[Candida] pseudohaemulonii]
MSARFTRGFASKARTWGVWNDFQSRSPSLKIPNDKIKSDLFKGISNDGPQSYTIESHKKSYHSPLHIDPTFQQAYDILENEAESIYKEAQGSGSEELLVKAEIKNPEVLHNFENGKADLSIPAYRRLAEEKWKAHDLMVTMQRLETLHVIPDTMPTLDPKVDVKVRFGHNSREEFAGDITPGTVLPAFAVSIPPTIEVQEFNAADHDLGLYTAVIVNPDTPDLERNSFKTTLHYGLQNVPLTYTDNAITPAKLLANPQFVFQQYTPLLPEKNAQKQRACLWVFRQTKKLDTLSYNTENFDIREFAETNGLTAVGAHVWRQVFDRSVNETRANFGLPQGRVFRRVRGIKPLV